MAYNAVSGSPNLDCHGHGKRLSKRERERAEKSVVKNLLLDSLILIFSFAGTQVAGIIGSKTYGVAKKVTLYGVKGNLLSYIYRDVHSSIFYT